MGANSSLPDGSPPGGRVPTFSRLSHAYTVSDNDITVREKKKKASKLATLRKKLIRARRHSRSMDYGKPLRELISSWSVREIKGLLMEYDALAALKELAIAANIARPSANSLKQDFSDLFDFKYCTDIDLVYRGACFPAHRALLSIRSPYFRMLLAKYPRTRCSNPCKTQNHRCRCCFVCYTFTIFIHGCAKYGWIETRTSRNFNETSDRIWSAKPTWSGFKNVVGNGRIQWCCFSVFLWWKLQWPFNFIRLGRNV